MSRMLPVDMFMFPEGLYVIGAAPGGERLLGAQVEKIGALTIDEAMAALDPVMPGIGTRLGGWPCRTP